LGEEFIAPEGVLSVCLVLSANAAEILEDRKTDSVATQYLLVKELGMLIGRKRRAGRGMSALPVLIVGLCCSLIPRLSFGADWSGVPARDNRGTVLIRANWVDSQEPQTGTATGFVMSKEGHVLTVAHQFPDGDLKVLITGETENWPSAYSRQNFPLKLVHIDRKADFAILIPIKAVTLVAIPTKWEWKPVENDEVNIRGFPLGGPLEGMPGTIRRSGAVPEVPMSAILRGGYSGAPVYDSSGKVVCMVRGGTPVADVQDPNVMGLGFCVPLSLLVTKIPSSILLSAVDSSSPSATATGGRIRVSYSIDETKTTPVKKDSTLFEILRIPASTQEYNFHKEAEKGYRIISYEYLEHSATQFEKGDIKIAVDGSSIHMPYKLTSGPGYNQTRGWLAATIVTIQEPMEKQ